MQDAKRSIRIAVILMLGIVSVISSQRRVDQPAQAGPPAVAVAKTGTVTGTVFYEADPKRPWRQKRYYVKDPARGQLAEAVVALDGKDLGKTVPVSTPSTTRIDQKDFQFIPETVTIRAGDRVRFTNNDKELHNVNAFHKLHSFNVNMAAGGEHVERLEQAGNIARPYQVGCVYHGAMRAWIYVFEHPWFQLTDTGGLYRLENVPPGKYQLVMAHPAGELRWNEPIEVTAGQTTRKDIRVSPDNQPGRR